MVVVQRNPDERQEEMSATAKRPTTKSERHVRIGRLIHNDETNAAQSLVELGARVALATELEPELTQLLEEFGEADEETVNLAAKIAALVTEMPEPAFSIGDEVIYKEDGRPLGKVADRYIGERGDEWEYEVRSRTYGSNPYGERELAAKA